MNLRVISISVLACVALLSVATPSSADPIAPTEWTIDGQKRQALVIPPSKQCESGAPVILVFHGHGGTMQVMERKGFQAHWPEAIVVCPQGLPTVTSRDPEGARSGWQQKTGDNNDRDVKFVDAILKSLRDKYKVDDSRVFATGHSNGGGFTYTLWAARGKELAAIAPVAAGASALRAVADLRPMPVMHIAGENDLVVGFRTQQRTMDAVRKLNRCDQKPRLWAQSGELVGTLYQSKSGPPFVSVIHPGGHKYPGEAPALIVRFFKEFSKQPATALMRPQGCYVEKMHKDDPGTLHNGKSQTKPSAGRGVYIDASGGQQTWAINEAHTLLWNRTPFIPFGTWFVSHYLETGKEEQWAEDVKALELLLGKGITDFYIGWANKSPAQYQRLIDWFEEHGCTYGIIPARYDWDPLQGYKMSPSKITLTDAVSKEIESGSDRLKLVGVAFVAMDTEGRVIRSGRVTAGKNGKAAIDSDPKERPDATVWYIPQIEVADACGFDWWGGFERHCKNVIEFLKALKTGPGLRLIIDPFFNEEGFYHGTENVIPSGLAYRSAFTGWLTERYKTPSGLNEAWSVTGTPVKSFEQAARLIPVLVGAKHNSVGYLLDNETQTVFKVGLARSLVLLDLLEARDSLYAELHCRIADRIKNEALNVPVVYKRVGWLWRGFINRSTSGGFDGLGLEVYKEGDGYCVPATTYLSELRQSRRPMWYITTETCHARKQGPVAGKVGYPDKETLFRDLDKQTELGVRGIYVFAAQPQNDRKIFEPQYDLLSVPEQYDWFAGYKQNKLAGNGEWTHYAPPAWFSFPPNSVEFGSSGGADGEIPIDAWRGPDPGCTWVLPTYHCDVKADVLFACLNTPPLSRRYGHELNEAIRRADGKVIYTGLRVDLGRVPLLDKYFTDRLIEEDGSTYQELAPAPDSVVLARTRTGRPWGLRAGNLTILARKGLLAEWSSSTQSVPINQSKTSVRIDPRTLINW